ncbi:hypothetical protein GCM10010252_07820 [Streptomyces aureoverticillatus]|nr:hypothetical protein GCM10010252_07820 [Streptomyces aureoverticillatus]
MSVQSPREPEREPDDEASISETSDGAPLPDGVSIPDEVWRKFEEDSERDIRSSAPKEPSARARMVAERLRRLDEEAARQQAEGVVGRKRRKRREESAQPWRPDEWRAAPTGARRSERSERWRQVRSVVIVGGCMILAIALLSPYRFWPWQ